MASETDKFESAQALFCAIADNVGTSNIDKVLNIETYKELSIEEIPDTESLKDTYIRVIEYYEKEIKNKLIKENVLISAHGNSIRALCKYLFKLDDKQISSLEIPTGNPLLIEFNEKSDITSCKYLDKGRANDLLVF